VPGSGARGDSFDSTHPQWTEAYQLTDHGLLAPPVLRVEQER
jgi:hypothetical protein